MRLLHGKSEAVVLMHAGTRLDEGLFPSPLHSRVSSGVLIFYHSAKRFVHIQQEELQHLQLLPVADKHSQIGKPLTIW